jgi:hypothetical protein
MTNHKSAKWRHLLQDVLAETDKTKLAKKAMELEEALFVRGQELQVNAAEETERQEMRDAALKLLEIKREKLGFPV